ncbi:MAG: class I SAM-dependent methyltransferase, partial [bacterium]
MKPKEFQYQIQFDTMDEKGPVSLGPTASHLWRSDPRHLGFLIIRYKFCAKMLSGKSKVLDVGCGDGFGVKAILQEVDFVHGIDFDPLFIEKAQAYADHENMNCKFSVLDITQKAPDGCFDGVYSMDVIEHIRPELEHKYMQNICKALKPDAVCIIGTPNVAAKEHASKWS